MGLGAQFSGRYYVKTVRSTWSKDGGYTQELEVKRNGFAGFTTPIPTPAETSPNRQPRAQVPVENDATYYTVKQGDTLWSIAKQFYGDGKEYTKISTANNLANPSDIAAGQELLIP
jgi:nucleoid-associated protein YgaU